MAKIIFKGVPDFTEVRAEIAKLKQEVASVSSTKVNLNGTTQGLNGAADAAGKLAGNLQKVSTTFDANGQATRQVRDFSARLGETARVVLTLKKNSDELIPTQQTVTENYRQQTQAAEKAAVAGLKATRQANAYLQQQERAAQNSTYNPTAIQRQIEALTGISTSSKSAADSANIFEKAWLSASDKVAAANEKAARQADAYLQQQTKAAQNAAYNPTALQRQIEGMVGIGNVAKNAADSAGVFERAFLNTSDKVQKGTKEMTEKNGLLGESFTNVYLKMLQWQIMGTIVSKTIGAFRDAISTMKAVDDEMVTVRKVTGFTAEQMEELRDRAYETASAYGEAADEYLNSVAAFARAGYGEQADALAELATKTKLVGDTNAETAQQFLLSVDAAYQYKGNIEALTKVLDGANEIDNKYATSIEKLAEGLGTVAPVAAQAHVGVDELTAAIGTITAVTQRSGSEAARAFRALVLNIVGDTKTEIDEGVTWTTGEIAGLKDVIRQYAPAAYEAAKATGEVIDPMEAIGGLAQSMKDGLLTEQKLMEMVSDIGGKLRTAQLLALIQNWDMYQSMLKDYANAVGSADKEIENALDSWTRKTNILKNEWTEFIQSMVSTETVKGGLDGLIGLVELLDTDIGRTVVTFAGMVTAATGAEAAVKGIGAALTKLDAAAFTNPWVLGLAAVLTAVTLIWNATEDWRKSLDELDGEIETDTEKLKENRDRIAEINRLGWQDKTPEILNEKAALEEENAELERQIEKLREIQKHTARTALKTTGGEVETGNQVLKVTGITGQYAGRYDSGLADAQFQSFEQLRAMLSNYIPGAAEMSRQELEDLGVTIESVAEKAYVFGEDYEKNLIDRAKVLSEKLKDNHADLEGARAEYDAVTAELAKFAQAHEVLGDRSSDAKAALDALNQSYEAAASYAAQYGDAVELTGEQAEAVSKAYPKLADNIQKVNNQYVLCKSAALNAADGLIAANGRIASNAKTTANQTLNSLEKIVEGYQEVASLAMAAYSADQSRENYENLKNAFLLSTKAQGAMNRLKNAIAESEKYGYNAATDSESPSGTKKSSKSTKSTKDAELERLKDIVSLRKSELSLMQERGDSTADQIDKMRQIQAALHAQAEYMRKIGASQSDINALSAEHWKITKQIKELQEDLWDELEDAVNKKLEEAEEARDKQTDAIDKQIAALKDAKEAEDESLKLEELKAAVLEKQNALLDAQKERTVRVFNAATGQWEWEANASSVKSAEDAYEKAKEDLAEYERELTLQREIDELEAKKTLIEETYNTLKAEWKRITDSLQSPTRTIDDILSDIARNGTPKIRQQVEEVNTLLGKLNQYIAGAVNGGQVPGQPGEVPGTAGANGSTGGYYFDFNKNPGGGWTQAEMDEGFKNSGSSSSSSGWQLADGSSANLNYKDTTPVGNGTKPQYKGPDMSRDEKLAGKTVEKNGYVITYDEDGYAKRAINVHQGAAGSKLSGKYPQVDADGNKMHYAGFNKDIDYTLAIQQAKKAGLGEGAIKQLETERQNKINALYGGKDPYKKYDSGGVLKGLGGIKATSRDEIVIPPFLAEKMLEPSADSAFQKRMGELGWLYGAAERGSAMPGKTVVSRTSHDHYGDSYSVNGVQIGAEAANRLTIAQVMQALNHGAGNLGLYKH